MRISFPLTKQNRKKIWMPSVYFVATLLLALSISFISGETEVRFTGQTEFVVNETTTTVIRLVIERAGEPVNVTAIVAIHGENTGDFFDTYAAAYISEAETNRTVYISVCDDELPEADETFTFYLTLQKPLPGITLGSPRAVTVTILSNDNAFGIISFDMPVLIILTEPRGGNQSVALTLVREKGTYGTVTVIYEVEGPNSPEEDLSPVRGNISFPPGTAVLIYNIFVLDDQIPEDDELFILHLRSVEGGAEINASRNSVEIIIKKNDSPVRFIQSIYMVHEEDDILTIPVVRGKDDDGNIIGPDENEVSICYNIVTGNSTTHAQLNLDFLDLKPNATIFFPPLVHESFITFKILDDTIPEIAETFHIILLKDTLQGDAILTNPSIVQVTIKPNDKPYGVLSINSILFTQTVVIDEDQMLRYEGITIVRNGGTHGNVSVSWIITRNNSDPSPVTADITPDSGVLHFSQGQLLASLPLNIVNDDLPEEAEPYLLKILAHTIHGGAEVSEPMEKAGNSLIWVWGGGRRLGEIRNISLKITPDIANGEIGFISNLPIILLEPEDTAFTDSSIPLHRDGTDGQATVFWSLIPSGLNSKAVTIDDISPFSGSVVFLSGQSDTAINLTVQADDIPEMNETLILSLDRVQTERFVVYFGVSVENQILKSGYTSRELIILQNDDPGGIFEFASSSRGPFKIKEGESVELQIVRSRGALIKQFLRYTVEPRDSSEFYGNTGILEFKHGEREIKITLLTRMDGIPELDEFYSVILSSHGELPSKLGNATSVNITILKNDDPHGIIQFLAEGLEVTINESKGRDIYAAVFPVVRNQGTFGNVNVSWATYPVSTKDIFPEQGTVSFGNEEYSKNITVYSVPDEIPEEMEEFIISLFNNTGGARMGNITTAVLHITKNDDPIYFADPAIVKVNEGGTANFVVVRNGSDSDVSVLYATVNGGASAEEGDFISSENSGVLFFDVGIREQNITVFIKDDDTPESDETFYIILFNSTGDTVVYGSGMATVIIGANDDPNGIFSLDQTSKVVEEGKTNDFLILRHRGLFGNVSLAWQLFENNSELGPEEEFFEVSGIVQFIDGERSQPITLHAIPDKIPEFNEFYTLKLVNVSGGSPDPGGQLAEINLSVSVMIPFNDDPFGVFILDPESQSREIAEDVLSENDLSNIASFMVWRQQGTFGDVRVGWEILSNTLKEGLPMMIDCLLLGKFSNSVQSQPHMRRHHTGTDALYFSGEENVYGIVDPEFHVSKNRTLANFTFSAWVIPTINSEGFIMEKDNGNGTMYYGVKIHTNESHVSIMLYYTPLQSNVTYIAKITVVKYLEENSWLHLLITLDDGIIEFFIDGNLVPGGIKSLKGEAIADGPGVMRVGAGMNGNSRYKGIMQDVRLYERKLTKEEIYELHATPARTDLHPISGYLEYRQGETNKSFIVSARDDREEEGEEMFILKLVSDEGSTVSCVVERTRGALEYVFVYYSISQIDSDGINYSVADFANTSGMIRFFPFQRSEVLNLLVLDDDIPELNEYFQVTLVSAVSGDGKIGSTPTSGASIDPEKETTYITIKASDHPYGLLHFSVGQPPEDSDEIILPATSAPHITVEEEVGQVRLLVVRAQGLLGMVLVQYKTISLTAFSPQDYQDSKGSLEFLPGERYKYIIVNITDNSIPELEKAFKVELFNPDGAVAELFNDGSGSGDGDLDFFLPAVHQQASLGIASHIIVTIEASDDAHGVFEFSPEFLAVNGTEPEDGVGRVTLEVVRNYGALSQVTLYWFTVPDDNEDLVATSGNITFNIEQRKANLTVQIMPDEIPELDKMFSIWIINVSCGRLGVHTNATLIILANDDPYGLLIFSEKNKPIKVEERTKNITLTVIRLKGLLGVVMVTYQTMTDEDDSPFLPSNVARATCGQDYLPIFGSVILAGNESEATIELPIVDDNEPEKSESVFVELLGVSLIEGVQYRPIPDSPRLGPKGDRIAHIIINANDDAFGTLQLSALAVRVAENYIGPIINVTRTGGLFADVSVKFKAVPITATAGEDYSVASSDVVLLDGETSKAVPIYIINDINPEIEESFFVQLLNETTGGALLGSLTQAVIVIEASDDPFGSFVFQITEITVEEPETNTVQIDLPIIRNAGTLGNVTVKWIATINGQIADSDLRIFSGDMHFSPGEATRNLTLEIVADDFPEIKEVIRVELTQASNGGTIGLERIANVIIPANDKPYGIVSFQQALYRVQEPMERSSLANITVKRSGGRFGQLQIVYSTSEIDILTLAAEQGLDLLSYYEAPVQGIPNQSQMIRMNVSLANDSLYSCAMLCLKEQACSAFSISIASGIPLCFWMASWDKPATNNSAFWTYKKNLTTVSSLLSTQAIANSDYETITKQWVMMAEGEEFANLTVTVLPDDFPEVDEMFSISLLKVVLINISASFENQPIIGQPNTSTVIILMNGDAFGVFMIYSISPNTTENGLYVEVQEWPQNTVQLMIHRTEGSLGQVTVEWNIVGGTATPNLDFIGDGEILIFAEGEMKKLITLTILDDLEPEDDESIIISLTQTEGGSRILPSSDTVMVVIPANDNVAGIISFQTASRSVIGHEGERLQFHVLRTAPGAGNVTVDWKIVGHHVDQSFENISGILLFLEGSLNTTFYVHLLDDHIPEEKEEYQIILHNIRTEGVTSTGAAVLDIQGYKAVLTVEASDEPHGVLNFAPLSKLVLVQEANTTIQLFINREFGSLGVINVTYATVSGFLGLKNQTEGILAEPGVDYIPLSGSLLLGEGETSATINVTILEDSVPEIKEFFLINLTSVELIMYPSTSFPPRLDLTGLSHYKLKDVDGLAAQIIIDANDGARGVIGWQNRNFEINELDKSLTLMVFRDRGSYGDVSLFLYAQNLEAQQGLDFNVSSRTLSFADGERYKSVDVIIFDDDIPEGDERFQLILANPSLGLELGENITGCSPKHVYLEILLSSLGSVTWTNSLIIEEDNTTIYLKVSRNNGINTSVSVEWETLSDTAFGIKGGLSVLSTLQSFVEDPISGWCFFTAENFLYGILLRRKPAVSSLIYQWRGVFVPIEIFFWDNGIFVFHHQLSVNRVLSMDVFLRGDTPYLVMVPPDSMQPPLLYQWSDNKFMKFLEVPTSGITQVKALISGSDIYLMFVKGPSSTCDVFLWESGQSSFKHFQSLPIKGVNDINTFLPSSGLVHILFASKNKSALYYWNSEINQFSLLLEAPSANHITAVNVKSLNSNKSLIVLTGDSYSYVYELTAISNQSDFIPSSGELIFEPGDKEVVIAVNIFDDAVPEEEESFRVWLKNPKGGAEIGPNGYVTIIISSNDDAHGVIAFAQISFSEGQALSTITLTVLADAIPEVAESVIVTLSHVSTVGVQDPKRGATIDSNRAKAVLTVLPNDSPHGIIGWHTDSLFVKVEEPEDKSTIITLHILREQGFVGDIRVHLVPQPVFSLPFVNQAMENEDYRLENKTVFMAENTPIAPVTVSILLDNVPELQEGFVINITNVELLDPSLTGGQPSVKRLGLEIAEIMIEENDDPRGIFLFNTTKDVSGTVSGYEVPPPDNVLKLQVVRRAGQFGTVNLYWEATPSTASLEDFTPSFGNLTFSDGQMTGVIEITIIDDDIVEFLEMFSVTLLRVTGGARLGEDVQVVVAILPNDSPIGLFGFEEKHVTVKEPQSVNDPAANVFLTVSRSEGGQGEVRIIWILEEAAKYDLTPLNGTLLFAEMESQKTIVLQAIQDALLEGDESYTVQLLSTDNTEISPINVRGPGIIGEVTVSWNITPHDQKEFAEISGTFTMRHRQSAAVVIIQALDDNIPEEKHYYQFHLTGISDGGVINESTSTAYITMAASDLPYGQFAFSQELLQVAEEEKWANVTVVRSHGYYGKICLWYQILNGTALEGMDFAVMLGELTFNPSETFKTIYIEIYDDDLPEGPEEFSIGLIKLEILGSGFDFMIKENGLQIDQPPEIGKASLMRVIISKSDNAEGIIEFDPLYTTLQGMLDEDQYTLIDIVSIVLANESPHLAEELGKITFGSMSVPALLEEDVGMIMIPVVRRHGDYGSVTADFISRSISALPDGIDYSIANNTVIFHHGQNQSFISVLIIDDDEREYAEQFEIQLTGASEGAVLGLHLVTQITIAKSDSPHGIVRFLNQSRIILPNPNVTLILSMVLERTGGLIGDSQINWDILGPNSEVILPAVNSDIGDPVNGSFYFEEAEGGLRSIHLEIYPYEEVEVQETYIIRLHAVKGETEVDPKAANITLIILKFGDPNGIVQFAPESLSPEYYDEPSVSEGPLNITLFIKRIQGIMGNIMVHWQLSSDSDTTDDFFTTTGSVLIPDQQRTSEIVLYLLPDDVPELDEHYVVQITSVEGGADMDPEKIISEFTVIANDDPYGVFALYSEKQSVLVERDLSRHIQINVTRHAGTFADAFVEYQISYPKEENLVKAANEIGQLKIKEGSSYGVKTVPLQTQAFLFLGLNFTLKLSNVTLFNVSAKIVPKILETAMSVSVQIPMEAANSQVAFDSVILQVTNITAGTSQALITRKGVYGSITVVWSSGYPVGLNPEYLRPGNITPASGTVKFSHGETNRAIVFHVVPNPSSPEVFAVHLSAVHSNVSGGARLRSDHTVAEIEPFGIFQFAPSSREMLVREEEQAVRLYVQRLFGYQSNLTKLFYQTIAGSAKPIDDFEPVFGGELVFGPFQVEAVFEILIIDDNISEGDELFFVNLTSVEVLVTQQFDLIQNPRLNPEFNVASVTILAGDIHHGILSLGPAVIYTEEDTNNSTVLIHIRRTQGFVGNVSVSVKTFGGINAQSGTIPFSFEVVAGISNITWAIEGADFEELALSVALLDGERESQVFVRILDDDEPEGQEYFGVILSDPEGGAEITEIMDEYGFAGNDLQNGILGFIGEAQHGLLLDEDSEKREVQLIVTRQPNRAFEDVEISWHVSFNRTSVVLQKNGTDLANELIAVRGVTTCHVGQTECIIAIEIKPDNVPELETSFFVELYKVGAGAALNNSARFAYIIVPESDSSWGLIYFAVGSRLAVALKKNTLISLQVVRDSSTAVTISVGFKTQELLRPEVFGRILISPAISGQDFIQSEGILSFEPGQRNAVIDISLTPRTGSLNPFPKRFQVVLFSASGGARVDDVYGTANITIVSDTNSQAVWGLADQLYQSLDESILNRVLQYLSIKVVTENTEEQLAAVIHIIDKIILEGEKQALTDKSRNLLYEILCALINPKRKDTRGYSFLADITEKFAFSLPVGEICGSPGERGKTILDHCPYIVIMAHHWYSQQINGHKFDGKDGDFIKIPERLLEVSASSHSKDENCMFIQVTEYSSQQWFIMGEKGTALKNKIFSVSLKGQSPLLLKDDNEITYRIYSTDSRIVPHKSLCLLWNQAAESWLSDSQFCKVMDDSSDYVECSCSQMSIYAAYAQTDSLSSYNEAFFSSGFICISGFILAVLSHLFCTRSSMFAAKLLTHMMVACLGHLRSNDLMPLALFQQPL
ncbi:hypothetical protein JD844_008789 [Phrynosoma platyrhinos]|uniref:GAIN-B domain-containing protein n=1 Tax=Phrynosoma platyrhinos TaxID=52577 RepID=A0ABQ7TEA7_PHRPL|nr:hypothetical protein JD844_008789 [Phrynosoma platyrhinos]